MLCCGRCAEPKPVPYLVKLCLLSPIPPPPLRSPHLELKGHPSLKVLPFLDSEKRIFINYLLGAFWKQMCQAPNLKLDNERGF